MCALTNSETSPTSARSGSLLDLGDVIGHEPVGFPVNRRRGVRVRGLDEAEDLTGPVVEPVLQILDATPLLDLEVLLVAPATASAVRPSTL